MVSNDAPKNVDTVREQRAVSVIEIATKDRFRDAQVAGNECEPAGIMFLRIRDDGGDQKL
jgi:hypothetical protein